jgi:hypothetical protein
MYYLREIISSEVAQICLSAMGLLVFKLQFSAFPHGLFLVHQTVLQPSIGVYYIP